MDNEYDFSAGVRGKHYNASKAGYTITIHNTDGTTVTKEVKPIEKIKQDIKAHSFSQKKR